MKKFFILATMVALVSMSANAESKSNNLVKGGVEPDTIPVTSIPELPIALTVEPINEAEKIDEEIIIVLKQIVNEEQTGVVYDALESQLLALKEKKANLIGEEK